MRIVFDLSTQPFAVGEIILYQEVSLILKEPNDSIEFVLTYDPKNPVIPDHHLDYIKRDFRRHLEWLSPATRVNRYLSEAFLKTHEQLNDMDKKDSWPRRDVGYMFYENMRLIDLKFQKSGEIPHIKPSESTESWAKWFTKDATTIQMRLNPHWKERNSDYQVWIEFLKNHKDEKFVIVCAPHEVDESLRLPNVVIASDEVGTDTEKICALIEASEIHMGVNSGPACMKIFGKKPFCLFKDFTKVEDTPGLYKVGDGQRFKFNTEKQNFLPFGETHKRIEQEFEKMKCN